MKRDLRNRFALGTLIAAFVSMSGLLLRAGSPQGVETWRALGPVADGRIGAAAVTLTDGRLLITGGEVAGAATDSVVVFNPVDGSRQTDGHLLAARTRHTATLLEDGRVLIAGGTVDGLISADLELFDPASGTSSLVASMVQPRSGHAAARLLDGRVLIAGGTVANAVLNTAEIFDPATGAAVPTTSPMQAGRAGASATTVIDGRVLVAGGSDGTQDLASAEIYDPWAQAFVQVATTLSVPRSGHTAVLLPGNNSVLVSGGSWNGVPQQAADLFLPAQFPDPYSYGMGAFAATSPLNEARSGAVAGPHSEGYALVTGGGAADAEVYRFATLKTDKNDYPPGQTAIITGTGWQPNTDVTLLFQEDPAVHPDYELHVTADAEGNLSWNQWAPEQHDLNVRFFLLATQVTASGERRAQITFTDGNATSVSGSVVSSTSGNPAISGVTITCTSGCSNIPAASTTSDALGAFVFSNATTKLTFSGNGPTTLTLTATKAGFGTATITLTGVNNGDTKTGVNFTLTPSSKANQATVFVTAPANATYGQGGLSAVASGGSGTGAFVYSAGSSTGCGVDSSSGALTISSGTGSCSITATRNGDANYNPSAPSAAAVVTIGKADATVHVTAYTGTYDGQAHGATGTATGIGGVDLTGQLNLGATFTNAPGGTAHWTFSGGANYNDQSGDVAITINKADATVQVTPYTGTYDGQAHGAAGTATGVGGVDLSGQLDLGATFTSAPGGTAHWTFSGGANYNDQNGDVAITINKADATVQVTPYTGTYDGQAHGAAGTATGVGGVDLSGQLNLGATFTGAPGGTAHWTFSGGTNYTDQNGDVAITINKAASATAVSCPASVTYTGSALTPCTATVTGAGSLSESLTVSYSNNTNAGQATASASYAGDANHTGSDGNQTFTIDKAESTTVVTCPASVIYDATGQTPCTAVVTGAGGLNQTLTVTYANNTNAGTATASASFAGDANHTASNSSTTFTIARKSASVTPVATSKTYGDSDPTFTGSLSGFLAADNVSATYSRTGGETVAGSPYTISAALSPAAVLGNYDITYNTAAFTIFARPLTITALNKTKSLGAALSFTLSDVTVGALVFADQVTDVSVTSVGASAGAAVGSYPIVPSNATGTGLGNYSITYVNGTLTVGYGVCALYDQSKSVKLNATVPVRFYLCDVSGRDVSSSGTVVNAVALQAIGNSATGTLEDSGNANPDNNFRFDPTLGPSGGYIFNLSTKGLATGTWLLSFKVNGLSFGSAYQLQFGVK